MAIYLLHTQHISRGNGRYAIAAAAYRGGERLHYKGQVFDYTSRRDVIHKEILLPPNAPPEFQDRQVLWSAVEKAGDCSTRPRDARGAREFVLALPRELALESHISLVRGFITELFIREGMCADIAIHSGHRIDDKHLEIDHLGILPHNPHAHVMLPTRRVSQEGFGLTNREWNQWGHKQTLVDWREQWANFQNRMFERKGLDVRVDHRSYSERGIAREPTIHLGPEAAALERKGIRTVRGDINRGITARNKRRERLERLKDQHQHEREFERERS